MPQDWEALMSALVPRKPNMNIRKLKPDGTIELYDDSAGIAKLTGTMKRSRTPGLAETVSQQLPVGEQKLPTPQTNTSTLGKIGNFLSGTAAGGTEMLGKIGNFLTQPQTQDFLGQLTQALSAREPASPQFQLGGMARENARGEMQNRLLGKMLSGQPLTQEDIANMPGDVAQQAIQMQSELGKNAANAQYMGAVGGGVIPWRKAYDLEVLKLSKAPEPGAPRFQEIAIDQNGNFTPNQLHKYTFDDVSGQWKYFGPMTKNQPTNVTGMTEDQKRTQYRLWDQMAWGRANQIMEDQGYGKVVKDEFGNPYFNWHENVKNKEAIRIAAYDQAVREAQARGGLPSYWLDVVKELREKEKVEY